MSVLDQISARAALNPARIVLCEGGDARILEGAVRAAKDGIARITVVGDVAAIRARAEMEGITLDAVDVIDPTDTLLASELADALYRQREKKGMTPEQAQRDALDPLHFANLMVHAGHADGSVAGAVYTTADVVRCALQVIGKAPHCKVVSSFFVMVLDKPHHPVQGGMIFSDCGLNINPDADQLTDIALAAANSAQQILDETPRVAMLSFSTAGSANHPDVDKVTQAARQVKKRAPNLVVDEDIQLDAAIIPEIAGRKMPDSRVQGRANVLIFPNLDAGNIGYKLAERIGGATAIGPLLQGLNRPANDLSRGCSVDDVYYAIAITSLQASAQADSADRPGDAVQSTM